MAANSPRWATFWVTSGISKAPGARMMVMSLSLHAVADQGVDGAADQALDDEAVEAANHQGVIGLAGR